MTRVVDYERSTLASNLALTARDMSAEAREAGYAPILRLALSEKGGFPEIKERIAALLTDPEMLQKITEEWGVFAAAYAENPDLMRFRSRHVAELLGQLQDLQREPVYSPPPRTTIPSGAFSFPQMKSTGCCEAVRITDWRYTLSSLPI